MTLAKGLGCGAPLGAFLCKQAYAVLEPGDHGSTFGGNALTTAAGAAGAKVLIEENWSQKGAETGKYLRSKLETLRTQHDFVTEVRGMGMLLAMQMADNRAAAVVAEAATNGLLMNAVRPNTLRFMPPLTTSRDEVDKAVTILDAVLAKVPAP
jgi:acetylornithine/succinyldiaminopimelate/putrescine aminotransferase